MTWHLHVPVKLLSANDRLCNGRDPTSRAIYKRTRDSWAAAIRATAQIAGVPLFDADEDAARFRHVHLVRLWGKGCRAFEEDDFIGGAKGFRDACQRPIVTPRKGSIPRLTPGAGLVWDDSPRWSIWSYGQERAPDGKPGVLLTVTDEAQP